jgi:Fur family ferric uptake transcriptional regulator
MYHIQDLRIILILEANMTYNTEKRSELLGFFEGHPDTAFSLEDICSRLTEDGRGKSTLYRQTASLVKEGYVSRISVGSRKFVYQYMDKRHCAEHLHLKCLDCGRLLHLDEATTRALERSLVASSGFILDGGSVLYGKCNDCNSK